MPTPETRRQLLTAVAACDDKKGEDTRILELDPADSGLADFFLITSATNDRQVVAIADEIEFRLKKDYGLYASSVEGRRQGEWILLDYVDIVIHVFLAEKRAFYDIERLRKSARPLTGPEIEAELKAELAKKTLDVRSHAPQKGATKKSIPTLKKKASIPTRNTASSKKSPTPVTRKKSAKGDSSVSPSPTKKAAKKAPAKAAKKAAKAPLRTVELSGNCFDAITGDGGHKQRPSAYTLMGPPSRKSPLLRLQGAQGIQSRQPRRPKNSPNSFPRSC